MNDPDDGMEYTTLGSTGMEVSKLCLGCMNFGSDQPWMIDDEERSREVIDRALDLGINFLDTANVYSRGESEEIVGSAIEGRDRSELVIATKVYGEMGEGPNQGGLSRKHIIDQCEASLERLNTDYIDLYQIHRWDDSTPIEETLSALSYLVEEGLVRYIGASTMMGWQFTKALYESDLGGHERFVSMQPEYSLVDRHEEENLLPVCRDQGVGVIPWSPLGGGFLTGKYDRDAEPAEGRAATDDHTRERFTEENWAVLDVLREIAERKDASPAQVSLAWLLEKEVVDAPIIGPRSLDHLEENAAAVSVSLTDEEIERLEAPKTPVWSRATGDL
ncbi:L-glyceraldehyde 3-phosphate reductase [Halalkalicoccus paucihalophilus]|uniref:L-glyceraldehyde 3-phosphate reductase n=2 Tax=Halalkalicoccus paucihalophilus TaxID=1008153 RepID=A0A151AG94_9EURY|nr:L-glyceraldehyde 3-phosphate reductase [Halalkalicoccus paucihalophilus]